MRPAPSTAATLAASLLVPFLLAAGPLAAFDLPVLPWTLITPNETYLVAIDPNAGSPDYFPFFKGVEAALALDNDGLNAPGNPPGYHAGYANLGFADPYFSSGDKLVYFYDCKDDEDCSCDNGFATLGTIRMPVTVYDDKSESCIRMVLGHELFHHIEYAYSNAGGGSGCSGLWGKAVCEGQARAMQDKIYFDLDIDPDASCVAPYLGQVNGYLGEPWQYLWGASYDAALWWTYLMEQYGTYPFEPSRGADFLVQWWENAEASVGLPAEISVTEETIQDFAPGVTLRNTFHDFTIANLVKDLNLASVPASFRNRYSYRDEEPILFYDQEFYDSVPITGLKVLTGGEVDDYQVSLPAWGARYHEITLAATCGAGDIVTFEIVPGLAVLTSEIVLPPTALTTLVAVQGEDPGRPAALYKNVTSSGGWVQQIVQPSNPYERIMVIYSSMLGSPVADVTLSCQDPPAPPQLPLLNPQDPMTPGPPDVFTVMPIDVHPFGPGAARDLVAALDPFQFEVLVDGVPIEILGGAAHGDGFRLWVRTPAQPLAGAYDLTVRLGSLETTVAGGIVYGDGELHELLLLDTSSSMLLPSTAPRLDAVKRAAAQWADALPKSGRFGLVSYAGNDSEPDEDANVVVPLAEMGDAARAALRAGIAGLTSGPNRFTSLGDALHRALEHFAAVDTDPRPRQAILVSDGSENEGRLWSDVAADVIAVGVEVDTVAIGPWSDQPLLQEIALATGGEYHYVPVDPTGGPSVVALGEVLTQLAERRRGRILVRGDDLDVDPAGGTIQSFDLDWRGIAGDVAGTAILRWEEPGLLSSVELARPDGSLVVDGVGGARVLAGETYVVFDLALVEAGDWELTAVVDLGIAGFGGQGHIDLWNGSSAGARGVETGSEQLALSFDRPTSLVPHDEARLTANLIPGLGLPDDLVVVASVQAPDGTETSIELRDDGSQGDLRAGDGSYGGVVRQTAIGAPTGFPDETTGPGKRGSYVVHVRAEGGRNDARFWRSRSGSFVVFDDGARQDGDGDGLDDDYERRHPCLDPGVDDRIADPDGDGLTNEAEVAQGTLPCDSDSDGSGENDGSEVRRGANPLAGEDDALARPIAAYIDNSTSEHEPEIPLPDDANRIRYGGVGGLVEVDLYRATSSSRAFTKVATFPTSEHPGFYDDLGLDPAASYSYYLVGRDGDGNETAPMPVANVLGNRPGRPAIGSLIAAAGAPRSDDPSILLELGVYNKDPKTVEMEISTDPSFAGAQRLPFATEYDFVPAPLPAPEEPPTTFTFYGRYFTATDNVSEVYSDTVLLYPAGSLGDVEGVVRFAAAGAPLRGALVKVVPPEDRNDVEKTASTDGQGRFVLTNLLPGRYDLEVHAPGQVPFPVPGVDVAAGETTAIGDVRLESDAIFIDGFESGDTGAWVDP